MKAYIVSDLHWDDWKWLVKTPEGYIDGWTENQSGILPKTEAILVAGDIANTYSDWCEMVKALSKKYKQVVLVLGNHDITCAFGDEKLFLNSDQKIDDFKKFVRYYPNVHLLDGQVIKIGNTTIGGCMGIWDTYFYQHHLFPDNRNITNIAKGYYTTWFDNRYWDYLGNDIELIWKKERAKLAAVLEKKPDIVMTHFCPFPGIEDIPAEYSKSPSSCFFYFDAEKTKDTKMWIAGHTHTRYFQKGKYHNLYVNPVGYSSDNYIPELNKFNWFVEL